jgi:fluoride exporter
MPAETRRKSTRVVASGRRQCPQTCSVIVTRLETSYAIRARRELTAIIFGLMNTTLGYVVVFVGGGLGAAARHWVNRTTLAVVGPDYPAGTLIVNITGSIAMGMLVSWFAFRGETTTAGERLFLTTGVLGGFTTFSAFALDTRLMWERHDVVTALIYAGASVILSILGLIVGMFIVRVPLS